MLPSRIFFDDFLDDDFKPFKAQNNMTCDIYEENNEYHLEIDAPGYNKEDISIECNKGDLTITAEKKNEEKENKKYLHRERRSYSKCSRTFYLGNVNEDNITAEFKDGILHITVPKEELKGSKKIMIN